VSAFCDLKPEVRFVIVFRNAPVTPVAGKEKCNKCLAQRTYMTSRKDGLFAVRYKKTFRVEGSATNGSDE
jgi:hypothetical protein